MPKNYREAGGAAFQSKDSSAEAIEAIFAEKDAKYLMECNTATVAIHYRALLKTLGQERFDALFPTVTIAPEWLRVESETTKSMNGRSPIGATRVNLVIQNCYPIFMSEATS